MFPLQRGGDVTGGESEVKVKVSPSKTDTTRIIKNREFMTE